jgi:threonine dehydratase
LLLMERAKQVVEGAVAAAVAALLGDELDVTDETVMPLLCGGNLDMTMLNDVVVHALTRRRQILRLRVHIHDQPGKMTELSGIIADHDANIQTVRHDRALEELSVGEAYLTFQIETSGAEQAAAIVDSITAAGYGATVVN